MVGRVRSELGEAIAAVAAAGAFLTVAADCAERLKGRNTTGPADLDAEIEGMITVIRHAQKLLTGDLWGFSGPRKTKPRTLKPES